MAKKATKAQANPFENAPTNVGADINTGGSGRAREIQVRYALGTKEGTTVVPGYFYIQDFNEALDLPEPWVAGEKLHKGEMKKVWMTSHLRCVILQEKASREIWIQNGGRFSRYQVPYFSRKNERFTPEGVSLANENAQALHELPLVLLDSEDKPLKIGERVILVLNGKSREAFIDNNPDDKQWGNQDLGIGVINELVDYAQKARVDSEKKYGTATLFNPLGQWKCSLVPMTDENNKPKFIVFGTVTKNLVNPFVMFIQEDIAAAYAHLDNDLSVYIQEQYKGWVREWMEEISNDNYASQEQDAGSASDGAWKPNVDEDEIDF